MLLLNMTNICLPSVVAHATNKQKHLFLFSNVNKTWQQYMCKQMPVKSHDNQSDAREKKIFNHMPDLHDNTVHSKSATGPTTIQTLYSTRDSMFA